MLLLLYGHVHTRLWPSIDVDSGAVAPSNNYRIFSDLDSSYRLSAQQTITALS
jgi:hypothetical protein